MCGCDLIVSVLVWKPAVLHMCRLVCRWLCVGACFPRGGSGDVEPVSRKGSQEMFSVICSFRVCVQAGVCACVHAGGCVQSQLSVHMYEHVSKCKAIHMWPGLPVPVYARQGKARRGEVLFEEANVNTQQL